MNVLHVNVAIPSIQIQLTLHDSTSLRQQKLVLLITTSGDDMLCRCDNYDPSTYCKDRVELDFVFPWSFSSSIW